MIYQEYLLTENKSKNIRISVCLYTNKNVIQNFIGNEWICLHSDSVELDVKYADEFKEKKVVF
jgi:hypothetical protein